jgi:hypothetical protein
MEAEVDPRKTLVFSYLTLRKVVGLLGVSLPFIVFFGALIFFRTGLQGSLSGYYYTGMRDVFVGILWAIGFFLFSYKGHERKDDWASNVACICAVGIAVFPTTSESTSSGLAGWVGTIHFVFAASFFSMLIYFSLFLFTKTDLEKPPTPEKLQRNKVYRACGYVMIVCMILVAIYFMLPASAAASLKVYHPVFWLETAAIVAFGLSWLTKGEAILQDGASTVTAGAMPQGTD